MLKKLKQIISFVIMTAMLLTGMPLTSLVLAEEGVPGNASYSEVAVPEENGGGTVSAAEVGESTGSPAEAARLLAEQAGLSQEAAEEAASLIFSDAASVDAQGAPIPGLPVAADGNQVDSITAVWITSDTQDGEDPDPEDASKLYLAPEAANPLTAELQINYSLSGEHNYEPGNITITIPAQIFHKKDSEGGPNGPLTGGMILPLPENPSADQDFNWKLENGNYVITNTKRLSAATKGYIQFDITNIFPYEILDMSVTDEFRAKIEVVTHRGNLIGQISDPITAQINTKAKVRDAVKNYYTNPEIVPADQVPAENRVSGEDYYVKVGWYAYANITASGAYDLVIRDTLQDPYHGTIKDPTDADKREVVKSVANSHFNGETNYYYYESYYPFSQFEAGTDYELKNAVRFDLVEVDHKNVQPDDPEWEKYNSSTTAEKQAPFSWAEPFWDGPGPGYRLVKNGNDGKEAGNKTRHLSDNKERSDLHLGTDNYFGIYPTALNQLEDENTAEISYTIDSYANVLWDSYVADPDDPNSERKYENYFKYDITVVSTDNGMRFGRNNAVDLVPKTDYIFKSIEFAGEPVVEKATLHNVNPDGTVDTTKLENASFLYEPAEKASWPDIILQIQRDGVWEKWATASWKSGSLKVTPENGEPTSNPVVSVPENTENFRTVVKLGGDRASRVATIGYDVRPVVQLNPTEKIRAAVDAAFAESNAPNLSASNEAFMQAFKNYGTGEQQTIPIASDGEGDTLASVGIDSLRGYRTEVEVMPEKTAKFDKAWDVHEDKGYVTVHYQAKVEERTVIHEKKTYEQAVEDGRVTSERRGTWYDLLPAGVRPLTETIKLRDGDDIQDIRVIPNYKGSDRTMLIVKTKLNNQPESYQKGDMYYYEDVPTISFDANYDFKSISIYGNEIHNVIAFESGNDHIGEVDHYKGEPDDPTAGNHTATMDAFDPSDPVKKAKEISLMTDLDSASDQQPRFVYAGEKLMIDVPMAAQSELTKDVQVNHTGVWTTGIWPDDLPSGENGDNEYNTVWSGGAYQYRLAMSSAASTITKNMIVYDILENFSDFDHSVDVGAPRWEGSLLGVDVQQLEGLGCAPEVYYSTLPKNVLKLETEGQPEVLNPAYGDLSDASVWTKASAYTGDLSAVTAIAVDARKKADGSAFVLDGGDSIAVYVSMLSPDVADADPEKQAAAQAAIDAKAHAYNNVYFYATSINTASGDAEDTRLIRKDYTKVALKAYEIEVAKQWSDDNDRDKKRPAAAVVTLVQDGVPMTGRTVTLDEGNGFKATFTGIPVVNPNTGQEYHYTFEEAPIDGYRPSFRINGNKVVINNIHTPEKVTISGTKTWVGDEGKENLRPEYITVNLYANDVFVKSMQVRSPWNYEFTGLNKYEDGQEIAYRVEEDLTGLDSYISVRDGNNIVNTYHPYGDLEVKKITENTTTAAAGVSFPLTFTFQQDSWGEVVPVFTAFPYTLLDESGDEIGSGTVQTGGTIEIKGDQTILFKDLPENLQYKIEEEQKPGFTLQTASNLEGEIVPNQTPPTEASLTNVYEATGEINLLARKTLNGRALERYQFRFEVLDEDHENAVLRTTTNGVPDATEYTDSSETTVASSSAPVDFGAIRYTQADIGVHRYTIREVNTRKDGYAYDGTEYHATVNVTDNGTGVLQTDVTYSKDGSPDPVSDLLFTNIYEAKGAASLLAWKDLRGRDQTAGEFTFELFNEAGDVLTTATNGADGTVRFEASDLADTTHPLVFDQTDIGKTYYYKIKEKKGTDTTVKYDEEHEYWYQLDVKDNGDGTLDIQQTRVKPAAGGGWTTEDVPLPVFVNRLTPGTLSVSKNVVNPDDANPAQQFRFKIRFIGEEIPESLNYDLEQITTSGGTSGGGSGSTSEGPSGGAVSGEPTEDPSGESTSGETLEGPVSETGSVDVPERTMKTAAAAAAKHAPEKKTSLTWWEKLLGVTEVQAAEGDIVSDIYAGVHWRITDQGELILGTTSGTDTMEQSHGTDETQWPWNAYKEQIKSVRLDGPVIAKGSLANMFRNLGNKGSGVTPEIGKIDLTGLDTTNVTNMSAMFHQCRAEEIVFGNGFDTSRVLDMSDMFSNCTRVKKLDVSGFNTSSVTNMYMMFAYCNAATEIKLGSGFDTRQVTGPNAAGMFLSCGSLTSLDLSPCQLDFSNATSLWNMFGYCSSLTSIALGDNFKTSNIQNFSKMFDHASRLTSITFGSNFDTHNATNMAEMFKGCSSLTSLDISSFNEGNSNTAKVTNMSEMFSDCTGLTGSSLTLGDLDTSSVTNMTKMFYNCNQLESLDLGDKFDTSEVTDMDSMFEDCKKLETLDLGPTFNIANADTQSMFKNCENLQSLTFPTADTPSAVTNENRYMTEMFSGCKELATIILGNNFNTTNVKSTISMFENCSALTTIKESAGDATNNLGSAFDTSEVTNMHHMFSNCSSLGQIDLGENFDTASVTQMHYMFNNCSALTALDLGDKFDVTGVGFMDYMFNGCSSMQTLDLGNSFIPVQVQDMEAMFKDCSSLEKLDLGTYFDTENVTNMKSMFEGCTALSELNLGEWFKTKDQSADMTDLFAGDNILKKIYMPEGFKFNNGSILPTPTSPPVDTVHTGKWTKEDDITLVMTAEELRDTFDQDTTRNPGTWVWQEGPYMFNLQFDKNAEDASGSMSPIRISALEDNTIDPNVFYRFKYEFAGWSTTPDGAKVYDDRGPIKADDFHPGDNITLYALWEPVETKVNLIDGVGEFTLHANEKATFEELPAGLAYQIWEETPDGWVLVSQSGTSGTISPETEKAAAFSNRYDPTMTKAQFFGAKTLDGKAAAAGAFSFTLFEVKEGGAEDVIQTVQTMEGGFFQFDAITYTGIGEHTYRIREVDPHDDKMNWDEHTETIHVNVTKDGDILQAETTYDYVADGTKDVLFKNTTKPEEPGSLKLTKKAVNQTDENKNSEFPFEILFTHANGSPLDAAEAEAIEGATYENGLFKATLKAGDSITLSKIPAGTKYHIEEGSLPSGWTLESSTGADGSITAGGTSESTFTNTYAAEGTFVPEVHKRLIGKTLEASEFSFGLYEDNPLDDPEAAPIQTALNRALDNNEKISKYDPDTGIVTPVDNPWVGTAPASFDALTFTEADLNDVNGDGRLDPVTKTYYIKEIAGKDTTINYDERVIKMTLTIEDAGKGLLSVTPAFTDVTSGAVISPLFENSMKEGQLTIWKKIVNETARSADTEFPFSFTLTDAEEKAINGEYDYTLQHADPEAPDTTGKWKTGEEMKLKGGDVVTVTGLPHGATYQVTETVDAEKGWTQVGKTNDTGTIAADALRDCTITNSYRGTGQAELKAKKTFTGGSLSEKTFTFELIDNTNNDMSQIQTAETDEDGNVTFAPIYYDSSQDGETFTYLIHEVANSEDTSILYDTAYQKVTVTVKDKGDGTVETEVVYPEGKDVIPGFTNYETRSLSVSKEVTGSFGEREKDFNFTLTLTGDQPFHPVTWTKEGDSGVVDSGTIPSMPEEGKYAFTLKHDETMHFAGITYGITYSIAEDDANKGGYVTDKTGDISGSLTEDKEVTFTNKRDMDVPTGRRFGVLTGIALILLAAGGVSLVILFRRRRRAERGQR